MRTDLRRPRIGDGMARRPFDKVGAIPGVPAGGVKSRDRGYLERHAS